MALGTKEVRVQVPDDLNVFLEVLAKEVKKTKVQFANDIVNNFLAKHYMRHYQFQDGLSKIGLQSELLDRRGISDKNVDEEKE